IFILSNAMKSLQMLARAVVDDDYDKKAIQEIQKKSARQQKRERKAERESTKGKGWFNLPATELTEETKRDLELLQIRGSIDPTAHYRKNDLKVLPKYFQTGT
uniref:Fcf2 domain-containing protein n=1 Tax=Bursaphelenchus xylophilus TaxID=6326 RepID=A0A1I7SPG2_BURXY